MGAFSSASFIQRVDRLCRIQDKIFTALLLPGNCGASLRKEVSRIDKDSDTIHLNDPQYGQQIQIDPQIARAPAGALLCRRHLKIAGAPENIV